MHDVLQLKSMHYLMLVLVSLSLAMSQLVDSEWRSEISKSDDAVIPLVLRCPEWMTVILFWTHNTCFKAWILCKNSILNILHKLFLYFSIHFTDKKEEKSTFYSGSRHKMCSSSILFRIHNGQWTIYKYLLGIIRGCKINCVMNNKSIKA